VVGLPLEVASKPR
jgi:hypothetical protein